MAPSRGDRPTVGREGVPTAISPVFLRLLADEDLAGRTVLDVGTGRGRLALALAPRSGRVVGIDRDEVALTDARRARLINEVQHRVSAFLWALLRDDTRRYPDDVFVKLILGWGEDESFHRLLEEEPSSNPGF